LLSRPRPARWPRLFPPELPPPPPDRTATTVDKGHGRIERRTLRTTTVLTPGSKWPGLAQGFEITRERTEKGKTTVETVYGITSLPAARAKARELLSLSRGHWGIENKSHYVRDVTMGEDACRVRKGVAPQVLAAFRNVAVHLLSKVAQTFRPLISLAAASRRLADCPDEALQLLDLPKLE
jgi:predicted transposase YbfD/YdcC